MTEDEARALFLSGLPGPAAELGLGTVMTAARLKVLAALPTELRARATRLVERFYLDAAAWFRPDEQVPHLPLLAEAVWESRLLAITYDRGDELTERVLEPLGLVLKAGIWYLVARRDGEVRTYRVSRIQSPALRDERFERPPGFNLASYWLESSAAWEREVPRLEVDVRVDPAFLEALEEQIGGEAYRAADFLDADDPEGWVHMRLRLTYPHDAPGRLLGLGSQLEVLGPPEARQRVVALARGVLARHEVW
jgi:predicted DNA-binding transcriptional regulator YafY